MIRPGYKPRKLVCDEEEEKDSHNLSIFSLKNCTRPLSPEKLLTIIIKKNDAGAFAAFDGKTDYPVVYADRETPIDTEYVFLGKFKKYSKKTLTCRLSGLEIINNAILIFKKWHTSKLSANICCYS